VHPELEEARGQRFPSLIGRLQTGGTHSDEPMLGLFPSLIGRLQTPLRDESRAVVTSFHPS